MRDNSLNPKRSWRDAGKRLYENTSLLKELLLDAWRLQTTTNFLTPWMRSRRATCLQGDKRPNGHAAPAILDSHYLVPRISVTRNIDGTDETWVLVFPLTTRNEDFCDRHPGICLMFLASRRSFVLIVCVVFFPTVACFTVLSCAQLILGKFLIVHRYSALKSARDLLDYFFFWFILFAWHFRASNAPLGCSPLSTLLWNWHDWNLHA